MEAVTNQMVESIGRFVKSTKTEPTTEREVVMTDREIYSFFKMVKDHGVWDNNNEHIKALKAEVRNRHRRWLERAEEGEWLCRHGDEGYGYEYRKTVYDGVFTDEEVAEYKEEEWVHYRPREYDCTGQWFTRRIAVFPIEATGKTIVYHMMACDI